MMKLCAWQASGGLGGSHRGTMPRLIAAHLVFAGTVLAVATTPADATVWRCHTPNGHTWSSQPGPSEQCDEYDVLYKQSAALRVMPNPPPQTAAPPPLPQLLALSLNSTLLPPPPRPLPVYGDDAYPLAYAPHYTGYGAGLSLVPPPFVFELGPHLRPGPRFRRSG